VRARGIISLGVLPQSAMTIGVVEAQLGTHHLHVCHLWESGVWQPTLIFYIVNEWNPHMGCILTNGRHIWHAKIW
jgi:hypothetical protein